jgi:hypothetical protein
MTTSVRFDDAKFADIQRRFREGKPNEAARRERHSRYDLVASLRNDIEQLLNEGYSFDGIAEYLLSLDVRIPVPTLKNYVSLARRKSGDTRRNKDASARRNSNTTSSLQTPRIARIRPLKPRVQQSDRDQHPIPVAPPAPETRSDEASAGAGTAPTTTSLAPEAPPLTEENLSVDERSTSPHSAVRGPVNGHLHQQHPGKSSSAPREKQGTTDPVDAELTGVDARPDASAVPMLSPNTRGGGDPAETRQSDRAQRDR